MVKKFARHIVLKDACLTMLKKGDSHLIIKKGDYPDMMKKCNARDLFKKGD